MGLELAPFAQGLITQVKGTAAIYRAINTRLTDLRARLIDNGPNLSLGPAGLNAKVGAPTEATRLYSESTLNNNIMRDLDQLYWLFYNHINTPPPPPPPSGGGGGGTTPPSTAPPVPDSIAIIYAPVILGDGSLQFGPMSPNAQDQFAVQNGTGRFHHAVLTITQSGGAGGSWACPVAGSPSEALSYGVCVQDVVNWNGQSLHVSLASYDINGGLMGTNTYVFPIAVVAANAITVAPLGAIPLVQGGTSAAPPAPTTQLHWAPQPTASGYLLLSGGSPVAGGPTNLFTGYSVPSAGLSGITLVTYYVELAGRNTAARFPTFPHVVAGYSNSAEAALGN